MVFSLSNSIVPVIESLRKLIPKRQGINHGYNIIGYCIFLGAAKTREGSKEGNIDRYIEGQTVNRAKEIANISSELTDAYQKLKSNMGISDLEDRLKEKAQTISDGVTGSPQERIFYFIRDLLKKSEIREVGEAGMETAENRSRHFHSKQQQIEQILVGEGYELETLIKKRLKKPRYY